MEKTIISMSKRCTGCTACASLCPVEAITMVLNKEGFLEPHVDAKTCISCGKCLKICPLNDEGGYSRQQSFYGWHRDKAARENSTSGGAVRAVADEILKKGGIVYGAVYADDFRSVHFGSSDDYTMEAIQKSKYMVSNPTGIYPQVKAQLKQGRPVLFTGAPCQVAGLKTYLAQDYDNLLTVDFVCGGMASLAFWQEHITALERKFGAPVCHVDFRSKKNGWGKCLLKIDFQNGKERCCREYLDTYYKCFAEEHVSVRETCLRCSFAHRHYADITVADFWGYRSAGVTEVGKGLSLIISNTDKGVHTVKHAENLEQFCLDAKYATYAVRKANPSQKQLNSRDKFFAAAEAAGFENAANKLYPANYWRHTVKWIRQKIKK